MRGWRGGISSLGRFAEIGETIYRKTILGRLSAIVVGTHTDLQTIHGNPEFEFFRHEHVSKEAVASAVVLKGAATGLRVVKGDEGSYAIVLVLGFSASFRHLLKLLLKLGSVIATVYRSLFTRT